MTHLYNVIQTFKSSSPPVPTASYTLTSLGSPDLQVTAPLGNWSTCWMSSSGNLTKLQRWVFTTEMYNIQAHFLSFENVCKACWFHLPYPGWGCPGMQVSVCFHLFLAGCLHTILHSKWWDSLGNPVHLGMLGKALGGISTWRFNHSLFTQLSKILGVGGGNPKVCDMPFVQAL